MATEVTGEAVLSGAISSKPSRSAEGGTGLAPAADDKLQRNVQEALDLPYLNFMAVEVEYLQMGRISVAEFAGNSVALFVRPEFSLTWERCANSAAFLFRCSARFPTYSFSGDIRIAAQQVGWQFSTTSSSLDLRRLLDARPEGSVQVSI